MNLFVYCVLCAMIQRRAGFAVGSGESATSPVGSVDHLSPPSTSSRLSDSEPDPSDAGCYDGDLLQEGGSTVAGVSSGSGGGGGAVGGTTSLSSVHSHHAHTGGRQRQHSATRSPTAPPGVLGTSGAGGGGLVMERSVRSDGASVSSMGSSSRSVSQSLTHSSSSPSCFIII